MCIGLLLNEKLDSQADVPEVRDVAVRCPHAVELRDVLV